MLRRGRILLLLIGLGCAVTVTTVLATADAAAPRTTKKIAVSIGRVVKNTSAKTVGEATADCEARGGKLVEVHDDRTGRDGLGCIVDKKCTWVPGYIDIGRSLKVWYVRQECTGGPYVVLYGNYQR